MKIFASNQFTPVKSLKKAAKIAACTLPLIAGAESCSPLLFPPPPPPPPHHHPHHCPYPHHYPFPFFGLFGATQQQDTIQHNDVFELNKNEIAYIEQNELQK